MSVSLDEIPETARVAGIRLRDELRVILAHDLVALWAHGGTTFSEATGDASSLQTTACRRLMGDSRLRRCYPLPRLRRPPEPILAGDR